jgi:hypothetical protein
MPGVVRQDDVDAGRIGYYDAYPYYAQNQGVQSARVVVSADYDHVAGDGSRFEASPWVMWTDFRARQNFTGDLQSSQIDPSVFGVGDLFQTTNTETAAGVTTRYHFAPVRLAQGVELAGEPGVLVRYGHTDQAKTLLDPSSLQTWDRRIDATLDTLDVGAYLDLDLRLGRRLRISGGPRVDLLDVKIDDHLAGVLPGNPASSAVRATSGVAAGPRVTAEYEITRGLSPVASYGEGFRSLGVQSLEQGTQPYSKIRSVEVGMRAQSPGNRLTSTVSLFETWVGNELVFDAPAGGMETESASVRRGVVGSIVARPWSWLLASTALSVTEATFTTLVPGVSHYVPNIPPILFRADVTARGRIGALAGSPVVGRIGAGYTFLSGRRLTDFVIGPPSHVVNAKASARWRFLELGVDGYNLLALKYADDAEYYVSNWSLRSGQQAASAATHLTAAPPLTVVGTVAVYW